MAHNLGGSDWNFGLLDQLVDVQHRASRRFTGTTRLTWGWFVRGYPDRLGDWTHAG